MCIKLSPLFLFAHPFIETNVYIEFHSLNMYAYFTYRFVIVNICIICMYSRRPIARSAHIPCFYSHIRKARVSSLFLFFMITILLHRVKSKWNERSDDIVVVPSQIKFIADFHSDIAAYHISAIFYVDTVCSVLDRIELIHNIQYMYIV